MSRQRKRHTVRQPIEEGVRLAIGELVGDLGSVDVERHQYDWRSDDLLVWVHLAAPVHGIGLESFQQRLADRMAELLSAGQPLHEWMLVAEHNGETILRVSWDDQAQAQTQVSAAAEHVAHSNTQGETQSASPMGHSACQSLNPE